MNAGEMTPEGALTLDKPALAVPCHIIANEEGPLAHVCSANMVVAAWGSLSNINRTAEEGRVVMLQVLDTVDHRGLSFALTADDARLLAASLMRLAETADGRRPS